ncbi:DUF2000 domain-containing protein, partial [Acinetobacter junii]|uniref:DUF2000 domain-containing protein n=1 Tax=Acinetobacter junii TaxID=40215 RepID=UPI001C072932
GSDLRSQDDINYPGVIYSPLPILAASGDYINELLNNSEVDDEKIAEFSKELQRYNRFMGTDDLPIIGLVPFSNILSVPRSLD